MEKVIYIIVGYLINVGLIFLLGRLHRRFNLPLWIDRHLPRWLAVTLNVILGIGVFLLAVYMVFYFGGLVYGAVKASNTALLFKYIVLDIAAVIYYQLITNRPKK